MDAIVEDEPDLAVRLCDGQVVLRVALEHQPSRAVIEVVQLILAEVAPELKKINPAVIKGGQVPSGQAIVA
jgi:hypothetical protein